MVRWYYKYPSQGGEQCDCRNTKQGEIYTNIKIKKMSFVIETYQF